MAAAIGTGTARGRLARVGWTRRLVLGLVLLALGAAAAPVQHAEAGGAGITAAYSLSDGGVYVHGSGFTPGGEVEILVYDDSWGYSLSPRDSAYATATSPTYNSFCFPGGPCVDFEISPGGEFGVGFTGYCPRELYIQATDLSSGYVASTTLYDWSCPW